jgi:hypothetical protein
MKFLPSHDYLDKYTSSCKSMAMSVLFFFRSGTGPFVKDYLLRCLPCPLRVTFHLIQFIEYLLWRIKAALLEKFGYHFQL